MKIVVVDDLPNIRLHLEQLLTEHGYEVSLATNATDALRLLILHYDIDVLLTDLLLRETDGLELFHLAQRVLQSSGRPRGAWPMFLLMTSLNLNACADPRQSERLSQAQAASFSRIYHKPIDPDKLLADLKGWQRDRKLGVPVLHSR